MRYQNIGSMFSFYHVHKARVCRTDGWTDTVTTPKTALASMFRAVKYD